MAILHLYKHHNNLNINQLQLQNMIILKISQHTQSKLNINLQKATINKFIKFTFVNCCVIFVNYFELFYNFL